MSTFSINSDKTFYFESFLVLTSYKSLVNYYKISFVLSNSSFLIILSYFNLVTLSIKGLIILLVLYNNLTASTQYNNLVQAGET